MCQASTASTGNRTALTHRNAMTVLTKDEYRPGALFIGYAHRILLENELNAISAGFLWALR